MPPRRNRSPFAEPEPELPLRNQRARPATYTPRPLCYHPADLPLEKYENENKIFVPRLAYQSLTAELEDSEAAKASSLREASHRSDQQLLVAHIFSEDNPEHRLIASIEAPHTGGQDEIYLPTYMLEVLGAPEQVHIEFVSEPLPMIAKLQLRILDCGWALQDPVEALQTHLEDYYVLQENITLNVQTPMGVTVPVFVEKLIYTDPEATGTVGRIASGDTELDILRVEEDDMMAAATPAPAPPAPAPAVPEVHQSAVPMIGDFTPPAYLSPPLRQVPQPPSDAEKERMRLARLARFG